VFCNIPISKKRTIFTILIVTCCAAGCDPTDASGGGGGREPGATAASPETSTRPVPSAAQATTPGVVLGERFASAPLTPSVAGGGVPAGTPRRDGSAALGAGGESSLTLTSVGSGSPAWGEPLLQWTVKGTVTPKREGELDNLKF